MTFKKGNKLQRLGKGNYKGIYIDKKCVFCGKEFKVYPCLNRIKYCSSECFHNSKKGITTWNKGLTKETDQRILRYSEKKYGSKSHFWKGGKSFEPYGIEFNRKLKGQIKKRDDYTCQKCSVKEKDIKWTLAIHHIDFNKKNNESSNLITLCRACHAETNYDRQKWVKFYEKFMNEVKT